MRVRAFLAGLACAALLASCSSGGSSSGGSALPGHGAITVQVDPNPIVARRVAGETWDFPFDVIVREGGGRPVTVNRVTVTVFAPGGISLGSESWDGDQIRARGYAVALPARGELRYHFSPRQSVPDDRLFGSVSAELRVEGTDDTGTATDARTSVTVTR